MPICDLLQTRQLNYLASLAQLPDGRLESIVLKDYLVPERSSGVSKSAPKNTVRNQHRKQLMTVSHLAPEDMRNTWVTDWAKLAGNQTS